MWNGTEWNEWNSALCADFWGRRDTLEGIAAADYIVAADLGYQYAREQESFLI
ncbi:hypothetical protein [Arcanobacterium hippocoleae]|uniref:hypothetical protein n=1 Tax=Arcanobacterium hippocoleae TaxID=149017 RepID=UPI0033410E6B